MTTPVRTVVLVGGGANVSGKEIMMLTLGRGLRQSGYDVEFICSTWGGTGEFVARLKQDGFRFHRVRLGFLSITRSWKPFIWTLDQLRYWPALVVGYVRAIRSISPATVVHTNWHHALLLMPVLNRRRDVYWSHEIIPDRQSYGYVFRAIARRVGLMVCVSRAVAESLIRIGVPEKKVVVIHNGIAPTDAAPRIGARHGAPVRIGIAGQVGDWKGHEDLIEALAMVGSRPNDLTLEIFGNGDGAYIEHLKRRIFALGLQDRVTWAGFVTDAAAIYDGLDICIVPSRSEDPLPTTAIEAGHRAIPVVATASGGLPEIVEDGVTGFLVPVKAPEKLADAIDRLVSAAELRLWMGSNARERMQRLFSEERFIGDFVGDVLNRTARVSS